MVAEILDRLPRHPAEDGWYRGFADGLAPAVPVDDPWLRTARPNQLPPPGDWSTWVVLAGRGWGKSRCGAEFVRAEVQSGRVRLVHLVGPTAADVRDVMIEGNSGLLAVCEAAGFEAHYEPSKRRVTFGNGAIARTFSAEEPQRLRGPQCEFAWGDELAAWRYGPETYLQLQMGLRLGTAPRQVVTTTPRPVPILRELLAQESSGSVVVTRGTTYENRANLADRFFTQIITRYEGTRLGRQEIEGQLLEELEGALWSHALIESTRVRREDAEALRYDRVVVAIDPAVTDKDESSETGIVAMGRTRDGHGYVLADRSGRYRPHEWASVAVALYDELKADAVVAEVNQGGDMVGHTIHTVRDNVPFKEVRATRGKVTRAEPVSSLYESGKAHHVGVFAALEDQMCTFTPGLPSPDRMDALVWAATDLMLGAFVPLVVPESDVGVSNWA